MAEPEFVLQMGTAQMTIRPYRMDEDTTALVRAITEGVKAAGGTVLLRMTHVEDRPY